MLFSDPRLNQKLIVYCCLFAALAGVLFRYAVADERNRKLLLTVYPPAAGVKKRSLDENITV